jgi:hypothetical protein
VHVRRWWRDDRANHLIQELRGQIAEASRCSVYRGGRPACCSVVLSVSPNKCQPIFTVNDQRTNCCCADRRVSARCCLAPAHQLAPPRVHQSKSGNRDDGWGSWSPARTTASTPAKTGNRDDGWGGLVYALVLSPRGVGKVGSNLVIWRMICGNIRF